MRGMNAASESKSARGSDLTRASSMLQSEESRWICETVPMELR